MQFVGLETLKRFTSRICITNISITLMFSVNGHKRCFRNFYFFDLLNLRFAFVFFFFSLEVYFLLIRSSKFVEKYFVGLCGYSILRKNCVSDTHVVLFVHSLRRGTESPMWYCGDTCRLTTLFMTFSSKRGIGPVLPPYHNFF